MLSLGPRGQHKLPWLLPLTGLLAALLMLGIFGALRPGPVTVVLDRRGIRYHGRHHGWTTVTGIHLTWGTRRQEPEMLEILLEGEAPIPILRQLTVTAEIRSLRNLAQVIEHLVAAIRHEREAGDARGRAPCPGA